MVLNVTITVKQSFANVLVPSAEWTQIVLVEALMILH